MIQKILLNIQTIQLIFIKNIEKYIVNEKRKILTAFGDMITDMLNNIKFNPTVHELFIRGKKLNVSLVFITQLYFAVTKDIRQ